MRIDPITDLVAFLTKPSYAEPGFMIYGYIALALLSLSIAVACWQSLSGQATVSNLVRFGVRFVVGSMWWQQSLWKVPPDIGGLRYWTDQMVEHAAFPIQSTLIKTLILPVFTPFAYGVYALEVFVAVSILLGVYVRVGGTLGALLIVNLFLGLYRAPQEWPWTYVFLILLMVLIVVETYGRSLGLDAYLAAQSPEGRRRAAARA